MALHLKPTPSRIVAKGEMCLSYVGEIELATYKMEQYICAFCVRVIFSSPSGLLNLVLKRVYTYEPSVPKNTKCTIQYGSLKYDMVQKKQIVISLYSRFRNSLKCFITGVSFRLGSGVVMDGPLSFTGKNTGDNDGQRCKHDAYVMIQM